MATGTSSPLPAYAAVAALAVACAVLGVFVVARRWAFLGEGIGHSGFGGAGTAWVLALAVPGLDRPWVVSVAVVAFCLLAAVAIAYLSGGDGAGRERAGGDAAIGTVMVASLAWGFLAAQVYAAVRHAPPTGFGDLLFGQMTTLSAAYAQAAVCLSAAVLVVVAAVGKELVAYCFDPATARAAGVRTGAIHYLLLLLVTTMIVLGLRVVGSVLVTALLVVPATAAGFVTRRLRTTFAVSVATALVAAVVGVAVHRAQRFVPAGPAVVLVLVAELLGCLAVGRRAT